MPGATAGPAAPETTSPLQALRVRGPGQLRALSDLKDTAIGYKERKAELVRLGAVPLLLDVLRDRGNSGCALQAAVLLGTLSYGAGAEAVLLAGGVQALLESLVASGASLELRAASAKAARRALSASPSSQRTAAAAQLFQPPVLAELVRSVQPPGGLHGAGLAEASAQLLAHSEQQLGWAEAAVAAGAAQALTHALSLSPAPLAVPRACLEALAALASHARASPSLAQALGGALAAAAAHCSRSFDDSGRDGTLAAVSVVASLLPVQAGEEAHACNAALRSALRCLCGSAGVAAAPLLSALLSARPRHASARWASEGPLFTSSLRALVEALADAQSAEPAAEALRGLLSSLDPSRACSERRWAACDAVAASGAVPALLLALAQPRAQVDAAGALLCLSRCPTVVRGALCESAAAVSLLRAASSEQMEPRALRDILAALCNSLRDSHAENAPRRTLLAAHPESAAQLARLAEAAAVGAEARASALACLRNLSFCAEADACRALWTALPFARLRVLSEPHPAACAEQECCAVQAAALARNLLAGGAAALELARTAGGAGSEELTQWALALATSSCKTGCGGLVREHGWYVCCNLAAGGGADALMGAGAGLVLARITPDEVRVEHCWLAHNLAGGRGGRTRRAALNALGVAQLMYTAAASADLELAARATSALEMLGHRT